MKDRLFFIVQGFLKYNAFEFGVLLRSLFYAPFFRSFGKNVRIRDGVSIKYPSEINIGSNIKIEHNCILVGKGGLSIGDNCLIGAGTKIITSNHNFDSLDEPVFLQGLSFKPVIIENDVWFGFDVKVLPGSEVGEGTIVGANTLINGVKIEKKSIVAGTPVRIIRKR